MLFTCRLNSTRETGLHWATPALTRHVHVANRKHGWNVRQSEYEDMIFSQINSDV